MTMGYILFSILHFFQFVLALTVAGLYGVDLTRAKNEGKYTDSKWVCNLPSESFCVLLAVLVPQN